jgi:DNA repair ATPase RecN
MLQFCHLALRTQEQESALDEQRRNLQAIASTAGDIRTLVGKLPPDEQRKAQQIVDQMNGALDRQGRIVSDYAARTDEAQKDLSTHTQAMEKGLASVEGELAELRALPANLKDLQGAARRIDETTTSFDARFADLRAQLAATSAKLDALLARPVCEAPPPAPKAPAAKTPASATPTPNAHPSQTAVASAPPAPSASDAGIAAP